MSERNTHILLAEDDPNLGILLSDYLQASGFQVTLCKDGEQALSAFGSQSFDLCLFDVMMPKMDGYTLAKNIRNLNPEIPLIFITAKTLKEDKLKGYGLGADDYITKPFDEEELLWKIKALIRRVPESKSGDTSDIVLIGKYRFDFKNQSLTLGTRVKRMTVRESEILKYLSDNRNRVIKREEVLEALWGENDYFIGRSLDVFITKMRKYLKDDSEISIENVFKVGFIFNVPEV